MIKPGTEITLKAADHWRYTVPRETLLKVAYNLERAKGCITDVRLYKELTDSLQAQVTSYKIATNLATEITETVDEIEVIRTKLTRKQKTAQWFKNRWKDFLAFLLGIIAATEAAFIIYQTVK